QKIIQASRYLPAGRQGYRDYASKTLKTMKTTTYITAELIPFFTLLLILASFGGVWGSYAQTTRYVAVGGANSPNNCTDPSNPCGSVQFAHNIADPGDIIDIAPGEYIRTTEPFTFVKSITIQGAGQDITFLQAHAQPNQAG